MGRKTEGINHFAFRPNSPMGLALTDVGNAPLGISLREATVGHFGIGPLHGFLEKGWSEPSWVGYVERNSDRRLTKCQEDSL
jgi:hypothetical protein